MKDSQTFLWEKIGRIALYFLFGLVPVFFLPLTAFPVAENKAILSGLLVFIAFGAWLAKILSEGRVYIPKTWIWVPLGVFLVLSLLSGIFSSSVSLSIWGNLTSAHSFFNFLIYALAMFLVPLYFREFAHITRAMLFLSGSMLLLALYSTFQIFGIYIIPFDFAKQASFNPIGTVQSLGIFLGAALVMIAAFFTSFKISQVLKIVYAAGAVLLALILLLINFKFVWLGVFVVSALMVSWQIMHSKKSQIKESGDLSGENERVSIKFSLPLILMIIVAILYFVNPPISGLIQLPAEVRPSFSASVDIAKATLTSSVDKALLGSGPSTFLYEYLTHRSVDLNSTAFWGVRFAQGYSSIATLLTTAGILGFAAFLTFLGMFFWVALKGIAALSRKKSPAERMVLVSLVGGIFLVFAWFFYPVNFTISLFTFLFVGLTIASLNAGEVLENINFNILKTQQRTFISSMAIIVLIVGAIVGFYWQSQKYVASIVHTSAVKAYNNNKDIDSAINKAVLAVNLDNNTDVYSRTLAQLLSMKANEILSNKELSSEQLQSNYQVALQNMIAAAQAAIKTNPADPINWRTLGAIYENNISIVGGADVFTVNNYKEAANRNPQNPEEYLNIARAYILSSDRAQRQISQSSSLSKEEKDKLKAQSEEQLNRALENLENSIALKKDYAPAHFLSSQVYERQGNRALAIEKTLETRDLNPLDTGVGYQLGLLYYLDKQYDKARAELERIVGLNTNFSNARYFLGLIYDNLGTKQAAIDQFAKVAELNPENAEVAKILKNLRENRGALEGISPPASPPQERIEAPVSETGGQKIEDLAPAQ